MLYHDARLMLPHMEVATREKMVGGRGQSRREGGQCDDTCIRVPDRTYILQLRVTYRTRRMDA